MHQVNWAEILHKITSRGLSQGQIAKEVGVNQSTICRLADGRAPVPRYDVGVKLLRLALPQEEEQPERAITSSSLVAINSKAQKVVHG